MEQMPLLSLDSLFDDALGFNAGGKGPNGLSNLRFCGAGASDARFCVHNQTSPLDPGTFGFCICYQCEQEEQTSAFFSHVFMSHALTLGFVCSPGGAPTFGSTHRAYCISPYPQC